MRPFTLRTVAALLLLGQLAAGASWADPSGVTIPEIRARFEQDLFELAHAVFLANSNLPEALAVAERAVKSRPADLSWRRKAAQTAEWSGRPELALEHWFSLAERGDPDGREQALRLSRAMQELPLRRQLLEQRLSVRADDAPLLQEYLAVLEGLGLPQQAYDLLGSDRTRSLDPAVRLTERARLAELLGDPAASIAAWHQRESFKPLAAAESLQLATLYYGRGKTDDAWQVLRRGAETAPDDAVPFWRTYADLAWSFQESAEAARASLLLIRQGVAEPADFQRLVAIHAAADPGRAYEYARQGWQRFPGLLFWYALADAGLRSGKAADLAVFLQQLGPDGRRLLAGDARSWMLMAQVYRQTGNLPASLTAARVAVRLAPRDGEMAASYLWLLVDLRQEAELRPLVRSWEGRVQSLPELQEPLAAALVLLGDLPRALRLYRTMYPERRHDPAWLVVFADLLEQSGAAEAAWQARQRAGRLLTLPQEPDAASYEKARGDLMTRAQLLMQLSPGDEAAALIRRLAEQPGHPGVRELVMGWALSGGQNDRARLWYWRYLARALQRPEWAMLGLALEENDRVAMADLLDRQLELLPYRDAVEAARRSGSTPLAEEHAFRRLQLNPEDTLLDTQVRELFGTRPGYLLASVRLRDQAGAGWIESRMAVSGVLTSRYSLLAEVSDRQFSLLRADVLGALPAHDRGGSLTLTRRHERGQLSLMVGGRDGGFAGYLTAGAEASWRPWRDLGISAGIEYHGRAEESAALAVGGVRDRLRLVASGSLTPADSFSLELAAVRFADQGGGYLGHGYAIGGELRHQLTHAWTDYGVRLFGGYNGYRADGSVGSRSSLLVPIGTEPSPSFFVPQSFGYLGSGLFLGLSGKNAYTRDWRPFAEADIGWSSVTGFGFSYGLGMGGPLLGLDRLMLELTQGSGQFGSSDLTTTIGISYRYYY